MSSAIGKIGLHGLLTRLWHKSCAMDAGRTTAFLFAAVGFFWFAIVAIKQIFSLTIPETVWALLRLIGDVLGKIWDGIVWALDWLWFIVSWPFIQLWEIWTTYVWYYIAEFFSFIGTYLHMFGTWFAENFMRFMTWLHEFLLMLSVKVPVLPVIDVVSPPEYGSTTPRIEPLNLSEVLYTGLPHAVFMLTVIGCTLFGMSMSEPYNRYNRIGNRTPFLYYPLIAAMVWAGGVFIFYAWVHLSMAVNDATQVTPGMVSGGIPLTAITVCIVHFGWVQWNNAGKVYSYEQHGWVFEKPFMRLVRYPALLTMALSVIWGLWAGTVYLAPMVYPSWMGTIVGGVIPFGVGLFSLAGIFGCGPKPEPKTVAA